MKKILTMDLGRGWIRYAITTETLDSLEQGKVPVESVTDPEAVFSQMEMLGKKYKDKVDGIALTMPGVIDSEHGIAFSGGMYRWVHEMEYAKIIEERTGLHTIILNDAKAAALAEVAYGSLKKARRGVLLMLLGTGIGGAIVDQGKIVNGSHFAAGEFSYMPVDYQDREEGKDMFSLAMSINRLVEMVKESTGNENVNIMKVMRGLSQHDPLVEEGVRRYCKRLATFIYAIQCVVDADQFSIGGNITDEPRFIKMIQEAIHERYETNKYKVTFEPLIKGVSFHEDSRKYGAVHLYLQMEKERDNSDHQ